MKNTKYAGIFHFICTVPHGLVVDMNKVYKLISVLIAGVIVCTFFSSCNDEVKVPDYSGVANRITPDSIANTEIPQIEFASNAKKGEYVSSDKVVQIALLGDNVEISGNGAVYENNSLKISMGGTYILSGSLNNGDIIVNLPDTEKSKLNLILNGVFINCSDGPVLNVENSPKKVIIYTAEGSVNVFCDGENYVSDISTANACV